MDTENIFTYFQCLGLELLAKGSKVRIYKTNSVTRQML